MIVDDFINLVDNVKLVESIKLSTSFERKIIIDNKAQVLAKSRKDYLGLTIWTDGSKLNNESYGVAVC